MSEQKLPLAGIRVVEFVHMVMGPTCGLVLADLGAKPGERQAVMVKHLARLVKDPIAATTVPAGVTVQPSRVSRMSRKK